MTAGEFLALAGSLAATLPDRQAALNLCERRDNFLVAFTAMLIRGQVCLLPSSRVTAVVNEVLEEHPGSYVLDDACVEHARRTRSPMELSVPAIPSDRVVVIGYTSGSTGRPKPNPKTWGGFAACTALNASRLRATLRQVGGPPAVDRSDRTLAAHVRHGTLRPDAAACRHGHPRRAAAVSGGHRVGARRRAQPPHSREHPDSSSCLAGAGVELPELGAIVSATAPLPAELAGAIERRFGTVLLEYFGSTETCIVASRRTAVDDMWHPYPGVRR